MVTGSTSAILPQQCCNCWAGAEVVLQMGAMRIVLTLLCVLLLGLLLQGGDVRAEGIDYTASIKGVPDAKLKKRLAQRSLLLSLSDKKPATHAGLQRRIRNDKDTLISEMRNKGYYGAEVEVTQTTPEDTPDAAQEIILKVIPGPLYKLTEITITTGDDTLDKTAGFADLVEESRGIPAIPEDILSVEQDAINALMKNGHPFPGTQERKLTIDHDNHSAAVALKLSPGRPAVFGATTITGLDKVEKPFIARRILWQEGDRFDIEKIARTRRKIQNTGVVAAVDITYPPGTSPDDEGKKQNARDQTDQPLVLDITVDVAERKHRTVGGGLTYSTTRGVLASVFWEKRNLFGQAEKLRLKLEGGTNTLGFYAGLDKPDLFGREELTWQNAFSLSQEELEAYDVDTMLAKTSVNWQYDPYRAVSAGVTFDRSNVSDTTISGEDTYSIISFPLGWRLDHTKDLLDPREGFRVNAGLTPAISIDESHTFITTELSARHYWPLGGLFDDNADADDKKKLVWANQARIASIWGQGLDGIPATYRLYAGGGGSARGYSYQLAGPLDASNTPTGGRSAFGATTELRRKWDNGIEGVIFFEGARVSQDIDFRGTPGIFYSAGIGGRYHTVVGPVRLDIAFPLNKRSVDEAFQFYISIGQAF